MADTEGYETFVIPDDVGGRFSIFDDATIFTLLFLGVEKSEVKALMEASLDAQAEFLNEDIKSYKTKAKSISNSQILPCNYSYDDARIVLQEMIQDGCYRLARDHYSTALIHIIIGYGDNRNSVAKGTSRMVERTNLFSIINAILREKS